MGDPHLVSAPAARAEDGAPGNGAPSGSTPPSGGKPGLPFWIALGLLVLFVLLLVISSIRTARTIPSPSSPPGSAAAGTGEGGTAGATAPSNGSAAEAAETAEETTASASAPGSVPAEGSGGIRTTCTEATPAGSGKPTTEPVAEPTTRRPTAKPSDPTEPTKPPVTEEIRQAVRQQVEQEYALTAAERRARHEETIASLDAERQAIVAERHQKMEQVNRLYASLGSLGSEQHQKALWEAGLYRQEEYERLGQEKKDENEQYALWLEELERAIAEEVERRLAAEYELGAG